MKAEATRTQIVEAADRLFYRQGYEHTSFAAIAEAVHISRGNFYYHFKSKDDILRAVIAARLEDRRRMLTRWEAEEADPAARIRRFVEIVAANRADIQNYGCPVGTMTTELAKLGHPALDEAGGLFTLFRTWLREQFTRLGHREQADALAMHVLAFSQGVATLAHAFKDEDFIHREVQRMHHWLSRYSAGAQGTAPVDGPRAGT
ncbi:TetR/AcrR family transcriptional regulator [Planomonospora venezuelensis]|uniref:AcrR family transcriptional regulator n=1 Tax=Planomonospora venezuelensis TaxID=1999 RepID=A0A841CS93_PLAVE|nr:AcrR family transcriptional regulator [Planomonospora venezuelensis]GIM99985.1 TetR family transcriptional regulator [Planomonospora venezuelensis]